MMNLKINTMTNIITKTIILFLKKQTNNQNIGLVNYNNFNNYNKFIDCHNIHLLNFAFLI